MTIFDDFLIFIINFVSDTFSKIIVSVAEGEQCMHMYEVDKVLLDTDFILEYKKGTDHKMDRSHFHDGYEIHLTLNNRTQYDVDERKYIGNMGSVAIFNPQEIHRVVVESGVVYERYYILFKPDFIEFIILECPDLMRFLNERDNGFENVIQLDLIHQTKMINLLNEMIQIQKGEEVRLKSLKLQHKFLEILLLLNDYYQSGGRFESAVTYYKEHEMKEVIEFLKEYYPKPLRLEDICDKFYISKSTLIRMFRNNLGMTPNSYLGYIRIIEARKLLNKGYPVNKVAIKVGFRDDSTFIKNFKKLQGVSPKQYALQEKRESKNE